LQGRPPAEGTLEEHRPFEVKKGRARTAYQFTAIDDATRVRALRIYRRHTQANAVDFINYVVKKFPFRIRTIRTDRGHEFQALFPWHVADLGMEHVYIKPRTPQLNGRVESSHRTDKDEL
jgi:transposase InsO family protein